MTSTPQYSLFLNSRFYVLLSSVLLSVLVLSVLRLTIADDQLYAIRTQQLFGMLCLIYWYIALIISPLGYALGKQRMRHIEFARRAIGVSAFYFAALHGAVALWGQLGGIDQLQFLPTLFQWSLAAGATALAVLGVMALTSFDVVVRFMTYRKWKWLHRLVYGAWLLVVIHVWSVGTHLAYTNVQLAAFAALALLSGLELYRIVGSLTTKKLHLSKTEFVTFFMAVWIAALALILTIPVVIQNYHSRHTEHGSSSHSEGGS